MKKFLMVVLHLIYVMIRIYETYMIDFREQNKRNQEKAAAAAAAAAAQITTQSRQIVFKSIRQILYQMEQHLERVHYMNHVQVFRLLMAVVHH